MSTCPLCGAGNAEFCFFKDGMPSFQGWCPACTNIRITQQALERVKQREKAHLLSAFLRDLPEDRCMQLYIHETNVEELADSVSDVPLVEQFDRLLFLLCERTPRCGTASCFNHETEWSLIRARDPQEVIAMIIALKEDGYIDGHLPPKPTRKAFERVHLRGAGRS